MISSQKKQPNIVYQPKSPIAKSSLPAYFSSPLRKQDSKGQNKQQLSNEVRNMSSMLSNSPSVRFTQVQQKLQAVLAKSNTVSQTPVTQEQQSHPKVSTQNTKQYLSSKDTKPSNKVTLRNQGHSNISLSSNSSSQSLSSLSSIEDYKKTHKTKQKRPQKMDELNSSSESIDSSSSRSNSSFESNYRKNKQDDKPLQKNNNFTQSYKQDHRITQGLTKAQSQAKKSIQQMNKIFGDDPKQRLKISKEVVKQLNQQLGLEGSNKVSRKHSFSSDLSHSKDSDSDSSSSSFENKKYTKDKKSKEFQVDKHKSQTNQQSEFNQFKKYNPYL